MRRHCACLIAAREIWQFLFMIKQPLHPLILEGNGHLKDANSFLPLELDVWRQCNVSKPCSEEWCVRCRIRRERECDREALLAALVCRTFRDRAVVFVQTKKQAHRLHVALGLLGVKVTLLFYTHLYYYYYCEERLFANNARDVYTRWKFSSMFWGTE